LQDEIQHLSEIKTKWEDVIKLVVGGTKYWTSRSTLTRYPSMLSAMFSGRHEIKKDEKGFVFIDRDGELFKYVLSYLRDGPLFVLPSDKETLERLEIEFSFFAIDFLEKIKLDTSRVLSLDINGSIISRSGGETDKSSTGVFAKCGWNTGIHRWSVLIRDCHWVGLGVMKRPFGEYSLMYGCFNNGSICKGKVTSITWQKFSAGDQITLTLDCYFGTLLLNDNKGNKYEMKDLPSGEKLYPCFFLWKDGCLEISP